MNIKLFLIILLLLFTLVLLIINFFYKDHFNNSSIKLFGTKYGGFYYPTNLENLDSNSIIYCIGAGEDISHDVILANKLKSKVFIYDPTPRAIQHIKFVKDLFNNKLNNIIKNEYNNLLINNKIDSDSIIFKPYAIDVKTETGKLYLPKNEQHVSGSLNKDINFVNSNNSIIIQKLTLNDMMLQNNHKHIDLLKLDIEGIECEVINKMLSDKIFPIYLSVDFDSIHQFKEKVNMTINKILKFYNIIKKDGQDISFKLRAGGGNMERNRY